MTDQDQLKCWYYFCSLCKKLENTTLYVDHTFTETGMVNAKVNSFEFLQIILLASVEFENIAKAICKSISDDFNISNANIKKITKTILSKYPRIGETKLFAVNASFSPLQSWGIWINDKQEERVCGIDWWDVYGNIKHQQLWDYSLATLENAVNAMASLAVLELYLMRIVRGKLDLLWAEPCAYFHEMYKGVIFTNKSAELPDFE